MDPVDVARRKERARLERQREALSFQQNQSLNIGGGDQIQRDQIHSTVARIEAEESALFSQPPSMVRPGHKVLVNPTI